MNFKDFEIRRTNNDKYNFELVKWRADDNSPYCFVVGILTYDAKNETFHFESVGLRYFEYYQKGLNDFIFRWCELEQLIIKAEEDDDDKF